MPQLQRNAPDLEVRLNGAKVTYLDVLEVHKSAGGRTSDQAVLQFLQHPQHTATIEFTRLIDQVDQAECVIAMHDQEGKVETIHWGIIDANAITLDEFENHRLVSRVQPYHFGLPINGQRVWSPVAEDSRDSEVEIVFNPEIDGRVAKTVNAEKFDPTAKTFLFLHPECQRTAASMQANGTSSVRGWNLPAAVHYLCWSANWQQKYFQNPNLLDLVFSLPVDEDILRNHRQPYGDYLPANLDALLDPYGFGWDIDIRDPSQKKIRVFRRGSGTPLRLKLQKAGADIDLANTPQGTNVEAMNLTVDLTSRLANRVHVVGDTVEIEDTFELQKAWTTEYDSWGNDYENRKKLQINGANKEWETTPALSRVWRDWVLNEGGDYTGTRAEISGFFNFNERSGILLQYMARRRKFKPCITVGPDLAPIGRHHGIVIEYYLYDLHPADQETRLESGQWRPIEELQGHGHVEILDRECGIRFAGMHIPIYLAELGGDARVRVTASVEMDRRVGYLLDPAPSVNRLEVRRTLLLPQRFKRRGVLEGSKHFSGIAGGSLFTTAVDDELRAAKLASELLTNWNQASINGVLALPGANWALGQPIGKPLAGLQGRSIDFQTNADPASPRYPTIMGYKYDFQKQQVLLTLDTWRRDV